jgi:hypothetical protein
MKWVSWALLPVASAFLCPGVQQQPRGGCRCRPGGAVPASVRASGCRASLPGPGDLEDVVRGQRRRAMLWTAGCAAGGLLLPQSCFPAAGNDAVRGEDDVKRVANLDMLDFFSSGEMPFALNELDSATVDALLQEEEFLRDEERMANDAIFTFRGEQLLKTNPDGAVRYMSRRNAVFFGETHDSFRDKKLATRILRQLKVKRGAVALGLEMVQQPFQPVLDWYVYKAPPSKAADSALFRETEWDSRWGWDFEAYLPLLRYAQLHKVPMIALNVEAELTARVRKQVCSHCSASVRR